MRRASSGLGGDGYVLGKSHRDTCLLALSELPGSERVSDRRSPADEVISM